jgi:hypothetical protein
MRQQATDPALNHKHNTQHPTNMEAKERAKPGTKMPPSPNQSENIADRGYGPKLITSPFEVEGSAADPGSNMEGAG